MAKTEPYGRRWRATCAELWRSPKKTEVIGPFLCERLTDLRILGEERDPVQ